MFRSPEEYGMEQQEQDLVDAGDISVGTNIARASL
jgi:hypothetical protein